MSIPNWVTLSRLLGLPVLFILLTEPQTSRCWWGEGIFLIAAATDWLDGYLARRLDQITELGKWLDPLVDKLLTLVPFLILIQWQRVPAWAVAIILSRELLITAWRATTVGTKQPVIAANSLGKLKTVVQITAIAVLIAPLPQTYRLLGDSLFWLAVALTVISGAIYLWPSSSVAPSESQPSP